MDIVKTLENCIIAIGAMRLRVDQGAEINTARDVINALGDVRAELLRQAAENAPNSARAGKDAPETKGGNLAEAEAQPDIPRQETGNAPKA